MDEFGQKPASYDFLAGAASRTFYHYPPSDTISADTILPFNIPPNNKRGPAVSVIVSQYGTFSYEIPVNAFSQVNYVKYTTICYLTGHKQAAVELRD